VRALPAQDEHQRRRALAEFERSQHPIPTDTVISFAAEDRAWADWLAAELAAAGFTVTLEPATSMTPARDRDNLPESAPPDEFRTIAVLSSAYVRAPLGHEHWRRAVARDPNGIAPLLLPVRVEEFPVPAEFEHPGCTNLAGLDESSARRTLLAAMGRPSRRGPTRRPSSGSRELHPRSG
jgi:hypothetical protein